MADVTEAGWYLSNGSATAHYIEPRRGVLRVRIPAVCGRKARTWAPMTETRYPCRECVEYWHRVRE